jgi:phenylacetate-CoA ligase
MAIETPLSICIRTQALAHPELFEEIFGNTARLPTIAQFNPQSVYFEEDQGEIYASGNSAMPLIRYRIGDNGKVLSFDAILDIFRKHNISLEDAVRSVTQTPQYHMPFVFIYERSDFSTKIHGAMIYPEYIKDALQQHNELKNYITGKFVMETINTKKHEECLSIYIELKKGVQKIPLTEASAARHISNVLEEKSAEYRNSLRSARKPFRHKISFMPYEYPLYFNKSGKQPWVKK